jgi:hypothetical protein
MLRPGIRRFNSQSNLLLSRSTSTDSLNSRDSRENLVNLDDSPTKTKLSSERKSLSCCLMHSFASVGFTVSPITIFLQLFSLDYYERQGAYLPGERVLWMFPWYIFYIWCLWQSYCNYTVLQSSCISHMTFCEISYYELPFLHCIYASICLHCPIYMCTYIIKVLAYFITLTRGLDVVFSPIMASLTDITVTPWGRRRPYLIFGCIPCAIALMMLLFPPYDMVHKTPPPRSNIHTYALVLLPMHFQICI